MRNKKSIIIRFVLILVLFYSGYCPAQETIEDEYKGRIFSNHKRSLPAFKGSCGAIPANIRLEMEKYSWRSGCPVELRELSYLLISHWGYDGNIHKGELIVNKKIAEEVLDIFKALFENRFPIERMGLISSYKGSDNASMADNNTSGFNCRLITGNNTTFSQHSYGLAIDINPLVNPYSKNGKVFPPAGKQYLKRQKDVKGIIVEDDNCCRAFKDRGWKWGGAWKSLKDYMHFEKR